MLSKLVIVESDKFEKIVKRMGMMDILNFALSISLVRKIKVDKEYYIITEKGKKLPSFLKYISLTINDFLKAPSQCEYEIEEEVDVKSFLSFLRENEYKILYLLHKHEHGITTCVRLREKCNIPFSTFYHALNRLQTLQLVKIIKNKYLSKRIVFLTPAGRTVANFIATLTGKS